ncbi:hypothetical protein K3495_g13492 [Podosphaera aphanis]|nr:hypothetical protein K3495_g13492 [Podosphaera aphanis]
MSDTESDDDLKKAIFLSLKSNSTTTSKNTPEVICLVSDEEGDENEQNKHQSTDIKHPAVKRSAHTSNTFTPPSSSIITKNEAKAGTITVTVPSPLEQKIDVSASTFSLSHLDRKTMESERLARIGRRAREQELDDREPKRRKLIDSSHQAQKTRDSHSKSTLDLQTSYYNSTVDDIRPMPSFAQLQTQYSLNHIEPGNSVGQSPSRYSPKKLCSSSIQYLEGTIKKTWARGFPRQGDDITIEEVLQKDDLTLAILSSFQIDSDWIMRKLQDHTKVVWVLQAKTEAEKQNWRSQAPSNFKFCFPSMSSIVNCMHSKLQLLAHPSHLRIVVPTANLVPYDWGETGIMENMCFLIDLPRHKSDHVTQCNEAPNFYHDLIYFLRAMGIENQIIDSLKNFDFSRTAKLGFVHSIGGSHTGTSSKRSGYCGLATTIKALGLQSQEPIQIDFLTASLGKITSKFIGALYSAAQGQQPKPDENHFQTDSQESINDLCRIYFPTRETVEKSLGGLMAGGTICFQSRWWEKNSFLHHLLRDCQSQRKGMLMHSKIWFVRPSVLNSQSKPWVYIGSANLSESAWGRLVKDAKTKQPKLNCTNWECGIIFPISQQEFEMNHLESVGMEIFRDHIPVPMVTPGAAYGDREPWFFNKR